MHCIQGLMRVTGRKRRRWRRKVFGIARFPSLPESFPQLFALAKFMTETSVFLTKVIDIRFRFTARILQLQDHGFETGD